MFLSVFFFKQKTAYEMRISDWSSDVCSSDLKLATADERAGVEARGHRQRMLQLDVLLGPDRRPERKRRAHRVLQRDDAGLRHPHRQRDIGRASCRERVCKYV